MFRHFLTPSLDWLWPPGFFWRCRCCCRIDDGHVLFSNGEGGLVDGVSGIVFPFAKSDGAIAKPINLNVPTVELVSFLAVDANRFAYFGDRGDVGTGNETVHKVDDQCQHIWTTDQLLDLDDLAVDPNGNLATTYHNSFTAGVDPVLYLFDSDGLLQWTKTRDDLGGAFIPVDMDADGNVFAVAHEADPDGTSFVVVRKYDITGTKQWDSDRVGRLTVHGLLALRLDSSGNIYCGLAGADEIDNRPPREPFENLVKLDSSGNEQWAAAVGTGEATVFNVSLDDDGHVAARIRHSSQVPIHNTSDGSLHVIIDVAPHTVADLSYDPDGNLYLATSGGAYSFDADGDLRWGPLGGSDFDAVAALPGRVGAFHAHW